MDIARHKCANARIEARENRSLERARRKAARQERNADLSADLSFEAKRAKAGHAARQDLHDATRDDGLWREKEFKAGDVTEQFNDAAEFVESANRAPAEMMTTALRTASSKPKGPLAARGQGGAAGAPGDMGTGVMKNS